MKLSDWSRMAGLSNVTVDERSNNLFESVVGKSAAVCPQCKGKLDAQGDCADCGGMFEGFDDWKTTVPDENDDGGPADSCPICGEKPGVECYCQGKDEDLGSDYETCSDCGYDHEYEPVEAQAWHREHGAPSIGIKPRDMSNPHSVEKKLRGESSISSIEESPSVWPEGSDPACGECEMNEMDGETHEDDHQCLVCGGTPDECADSGCYGDMFPHDEDDQTKEKSMRVKSEGMKSVLDRDLGLNSESADMEEDLTEADEEPVTMRGSPTTQRSPDSPTSPPVRTSKAVPSSGRSNITGPASKRFFKQIDTLVDSWEEDQLSKGRNKVSATKAATSLHTLIANAMDKFEVALGESRKVRRGNGK